jgi:hypothetical protein
MDGQAEPISLRPRYVHLRNWCIACVITAAGVLVFVAAVAIGLIGANYHFLSDILGGIFVGISVGYITRKIARGKLISEFSPSNTTTPLGGNQRNDVAPRADTNQQISIPRNVTDVIFELAAARAFDGARRPP